MYDEKICNKHQSLTTILANSQKWNGMKETKENFKPNKKNKNKFLYGNEHNFVSVFVYPIHAMSEACFIKC